MSDDSDIENEVDEILLKMNKKKTKVQSEEEEEPKPKKKRKPRGPASDKQKKALEEGRRRRLQDVEINRLEKERKRGEREKKLARLKKEKAARDDDDDLKGSGKEDQITALQKQVEEMKHLINKQSSQPIINVHQAPNPVKVVDPNQDAYERQLRKYCKI
jgi:phage I-like protein